MKFLFVAILIALAIQLASAQTATTTEAATTTASSATTTTAASAISSTTTRTRRCWRGNNWCHTRIPNKKCKNPKRCHKTVVIVTHKKG